MVGVAAAVVKNYVRVLVGGEGDVVGKLVDHTWRQSLEARSRPGMDFVQVGGRSFCGSRGRVLAAAAAATVQAVLSSRALGKGLLVGLLVLAQRAPHPAILQGRK